MDARYRKSYSGLTRRQIKEEKFMMGERAQEGPTVFIVTSAKFARAASSGYRIASTFAVVLCARVRYNRYQPEKE